MSKIPFRLLSTAAGVALAFGAPTLARAGGTIVTAHSLTISFHAATEFTNSGGDDKTDKTDFKQATSTTRASVPSRRRPRGSTCSSPTP
jgi:hypothetical protein